MTQQEEHLVNHMTVKLTAHTEAETQARTALHEMVSELTSDLVALRSRVQYLNVLTGNQGLAIDHVARTVTDHSKQLAELQRLCH